MIIPINMYPGTFPCCFGMAPRDILSFYFTTMGIKITLSCFPGILYGSLKTNLKAFKLNGLTAFTTFDRTEHSQKYAFQKKKKRNRFSFKNRRVEIIAVIICFYLGLNCSCENLFHCAFKYCIMRHQILF